MSRRREPCRNFQRGSCHYGDRCKFLHVSQQQPRQNSFGFGALNTSQSFNTNQQQTPNPFGFGVQNDSVPSGSKGTPSFDGSRYETPAKPFENKWIRPSSTTTPNSIQQASTQPQTATHQCTGPESCKRQIVEDFKNELPLWRLTCYGHWKNRPCDIVGDISYEELRGAAYEDAKRGLRMQAIVERERNLYNSKCIEFDNLLRNPNIIRTSSSAETNFPPGTNNNTPLGVQNNTPAHSNAPPSFSSFSQLGESTNLGSNARPQAPATPPNSFSSQPNLPQYNSQNSGGMRMKFGNSGLFGGQLPIQPPGSSPGLNITNFQNGVMATGSNQASPLVPTQFPSITSNQWPSSLNVPTAIQDTVNQAPTLDKQEDGLNDSIWLKKEWALGEIPIVAPPGSLLSSFSRFRLYISSPGNLLHMNAITCISLSLAMREMGNEKGRSTAHKSS